MSASSRRSRANAWSRALTTTTPAPPVTSAPLAENRAAFDRVFFRPRVLIDVARIDASIDLLGHRLSFPVMLAPTAFNRLGHPDGELAAARAAGRAGTLMVVSTSASATIEEVAGQASGPLWFQLYVYRDRDITRDLVSRAAASGCTAIVLTVDMPRMGRRERDVRNRFSLPPDVTMRNLEGAGRPDIARWGEDSSFMEYVHAQLDPSLTWEAVEWLKTVTALPILIKGVLSADDAERAIEAGAAGVIVSNHGGRQLDGAMATIDALPDIAAKVGDRLPVLMDGGIRRGTDVLALALGARAVLIGRPYLWGCRGWRSRCARSSICSGQSSSSRWLAGAPRIGDITRSSSRTAGDPRVNLNRTSIGPVCRFKPRCYNPAVAHASIHNRTNRPARVVVKKEARAMSLSLPVSRQAVVTAAALGSPACTWLPARSDSRGQLQPWCERFRAGPCPAA